MRGAQAPARGARVPENRPPYMRGRTSTGVARSFAASFSAVGRRVREELLEARDTGS